MKKKIAEESGVRADWAINLDVSVTCSRFSLAPRSAANNTNNQEDQRHKRDKTLVDTTAMTPSDCYSSRFFFSPSFVFWSFPRSIYFGIIHLFIIFVSSPSTILL